MSIEALKAAEIYAQVAKAGASAPRTESVEGTVQPNFAEMVKSAVESTSANLQAGEAAGAAVATGEASLVDVVTAVSAAEVSLEAAIAVRNRVIEAYQEIMRMPI